MPGIYFDNHTDRWRLLIHGYDRGEGASYPVQVDDITHNLIILEVDHAKIHAGRSFTAEYTRVTDATDGHRSGLYIKTPRVVHGRCHAIISFAASTAANLSICEAPTIAANTGTHTGVIYNRFRDSPNESMCLNNATTPVSGLFTTLTEAQIAGDATWATGTVVRTEPLRVGDNPKPAGGYSRGSEEYILKANTAYVFLITNTTAAANTHYIICDWYEDHSVH